MRGIKTDRFGNAYKSIFCKHNRNGYPVGYFEIGSVLYKVEPGQEATDNKGNSGVWVKVTKMPKRNRQTSF